MVNNNHATIFLEIKLRRRTTSLQNDNSSQATRYFTKKPRLRINLKKCFYVDHNLGKICETFTSSKIIHLVGFSTNGLSNGTRAPSVITIICKH